MAGCTLLRLGRVIDQAANAAGSQTLNDPSSRVAALLISTGEGQVIVNDVFALVSATDGPSTDQGSGLEIAPLSALSLEQK